MERAKKRIACFVVIFLIYSSAFAQDVYYVTFVKGDIKNIILNKRKVELARKLEEEVYENATKRKDFEIFTP